jgi:hypothetical protein
MLPAMKTWLALAVTVLMFGIVGLQSVWACGDKFLVVGRGVRFQNVYAAIHPASILIVVPPKSVKNAAVRDSRLQTALRMAGHRVQTTSLAGLSDVLSRSRYDIILAERADAVAIPNVTPAGQLKASVVGVLERASSTELAAVRPQLDAVLNTPRSLPDILKLFDDVMAARQGKARLAGL